MKIKFWGVRGSITTPHKDKIKYGGNTSCVQVFNNKDEFAILDAGIGIINLGKSLNIPPYSQGKGTINIVLSHTHWDHIQGIPFFSPIFKAGNRVIIHCNNRIYKSIYETIGNLFSSFYSPHKHIENLSAKFEFNEIVEKDFLIHGMIFTPIQLVHPVTCFGYRISCEDKNIAYITDHEIENREDTKLFESFLQKADLVVHDTHFLEADYLKHKGWGHSSLERVLEMGQEFGIKHLVMFHHAPENSDSELERMLDYGRNILSKANSKMVLSLAKENEEILL